MSTVGYVLLESSLFDSMIVEKRRGKCYSHRLSKRQKTTHKCSRRFLNLRFRFDRLLHGVGASWVRSGDVSYDWTGYTFDPVLFSEEDSERIIGMEIHITPGGLWQMEHLWTLDV